MDLSEFAIFPSLKGKGVLVTGGGSGIGGAITECFCQQGAKVAFIDIDKAASEKLTADIKKEHGNAPTFIACDLRDVAALKSAVASAVKAVGPIDALVNNAAHDDRHEWADVTADYWDERMAVNLRHMFFTTQAIAPEMAKRGGGAIINFGSISYKLKIGNYPAYTTAKAAVHGLTTSAARQFGRSGVRVNTLLPGWVMTERQLKLWVTKEGEETLDREQPLSGRIMPVDIARMVLFLASADGRMCSGQEFTVDAGWA